MADVNFCDLSQIRKRAMQRAHEVAGKIREQGIPVTPQVFGKCYREAYRQEKKKCEGAGLTPEQQEQVKKLIEAEFSSEQGKTIEMQTLQGPGQEMQQEKS